MGLRSWFVWRRFRFRLWLIWCPWLNLWPFRLYRAWKNRHQVARISGFGPLSTEPNDNIRRVEPPGIADVYEDIWPWN